MGTITTAIVGTAESLLLQINPADPVAARAQLTFRGQDAVPAKILTDVSLYTLTLTLPPNFVYRLIDFDLILRGDGISVLNDWEKAFQFQLQNASQDIRTYGVWRSGTGETSVAFVWNQDTTNKTMAVYPLPQGAMDFPFLSSGDGGELFVRLWDVSADSTGSVSVLYFARFLQYTVEQFNASPMHTPTPVLSV